MLIPYLSYSNKGYRKNIDPYLLDLHKLAAFLARKSYGQVHLIADTKGADQLKSVYFDSVTILPEMDEIKDEYSVTWSLGKLMAFRHLSKNKIPFIHIDYDVFLWERLPQFIDNAGVFAQHIEPSVRGKYELDCFDNFCRKKYFAENYKPSYAYNMGIFGGQDSEFIEKYSSSSIEMVLDKKNKYYWTRNDVLNVNLHWSRATVAEQWYLAVCAEALNKDITCLFDRSKNECPYPEDAEKFGYTHLWGYKHHEPTKKKIYEIMRNYRLL